MVDETLEQEVVGRRVSIRWTGDKGRPWYTGRIAEFWPTSGEHLVVYEDGEQKAHDLADEVGNGQLRWLPAATSPRSLKYLTGYRLTTTTNKSGLPANYRILPKGKILPNYRILPKGTHKVEAHAGAAKKIAEQPSQPAKTAPKRSQTYGADASSGKQPAKKSRASTAAPAESAPAKPPRRSPSPPPYEGEELRLAEKAVYDRVIAQRVARGEDPPPYKDEELAAAELRIDKLVMAQRKARGAACPAFGGAA